MQYMFEKRFGLSFGVTPSGDYDPKTTVPADSSPPSTTAPTQISAVGEIFEAKESEPTEPVATSAYTAADEKTLKLLEGKKEGEAMSFLADEKLEEVVRKQQESAKYRTQNIIFHDERTADWSLGGDPKNPLKGSPVEKIVEFKGEDLVFKKDGETTTRKFKNDTEVKGLQEADIVGLMETLPGFEEMETEQKNLLYKEVMAQGKDKSGQEQLLAQLNYVMKRSMTIHTVEQAIGSAQSREDAQGLARSSRDLFGSANRHFDPTNAENKRDYFYWRLEEEGASPEEIADVKDAVRTHDQDERTGTDYESLLKFKSPDDILDYLKPGERRPKNTDEIKKDEQKRSQTEPAAALDRAEKIPQEKIAAFEKIAESEKGKEQVEARKAAQTEEAKHLKLGAQETLLKGILKKKDVEKFLTTPIAPPSDVAIQDPDAELREEKSEAHEVLKQAGLDAAKLKSFEKGTLTLEQARTVLKEVTAKKIESEKKIKASNQHADDLDRETGLYRAYQEARDARKTYSDLLEKHSKGDFTGASDDYRKLTGEKNLPGKKDDVFGYDKLNGKDAVKHYKDISEDVRSAEKAKQDAKLKVVDDAVSTPLSYIDKAKNLMTTASGFVGDINTLGEALNLKLNQAEAADLRASVKYDALFGDKGPGGRLFSRDKLKDFVKFEKKEAADGSAGKRLADLASPEKSGPARRQGINTAKAQSAKTSAEAHKTGAEGVVAENKEQASGGKKRLYKVPTNYGGPGIPV